MSQVKRFSRLPLPLQFEIEERLVRNGFSEYREIASELRQRGYRISRSGLHRYGVELKKRYLDKRAELLAKGSVPRRARRS